MKNDNSIASYIVPTIFFACVAAWLTHIIACLSTGAWGFLLAGALFFPVAIIHGVGVWFGAW